MTVNERGPLAAGVIGALANDAGAPAIARATAIKELPAYLDIAALDAIDTAWRMPIRWCAARRARTMAPPSPAPPPMRAGDAMRPRSNFPFAPYSLCLLPGWQRETRVNTAIIRPLATAVLFIAAYALPVMAVDQAELAKKSLNPVAALVSLPLQLNYDGNIGQAEQGDKWQLNVQPVIPFSIGQDWSLGRQPGRRRAGGMGEWIALTFLFPKWLNLQSNLKE